MKKLNILILLSLTPVFLSACGDLASTPTPTLTNTPKPTHTASPIPTGTPTAEPTATEVPTETSSPSPTATKKPAATPTATEEELLLSLPKGEPLTEWNGIPIMPNAIYGEESDDAYEFTIDAPVAQIKAFYENELGKLGWVLLGGGQTENGSALYIFTKGEKTITISMLPQKGVILVLILI